MDILLQFEIWIILAIIFSLAEIFVPGGILLNLGLSSLLIALGVQQKILDTWVITLTAWFFVASMMLFLVYYLTDKYFKGDQTIANSHEEVDVYGTEVNVIAQIGPGNAAGRIQFQGTTWSALGDGTLIQVGEKASIICKENISYIVEPVKK